MTSFLNLVATRIFLCLHWQEPCDDVEMTADPATKQTSKQKSTETEGLNSAVTELRRQMNGKAAGAPSRGLAEVM